MKMLQALFFISTLLLSSTVMAQDSSSQKKALFIKTDLLLPLVGIDPDFSGGSFTVELGVKRRHSFQLTGLIANNQMDGTQHKSIQIIPAYKFFWSKKGYRGFYTGLYLKGGQYQTIIDQTHTPENYYIEYSENVISEGLMMGYQNYIFKRIVIDVLFGMGTSQLLNRTMIASENIVDVHLKEDHTDGIMAINIGYKF